MPKLFIVSDIHGFYNQFRKFLDQAGFDETNPDHWLISCGDHFDRGPKNNEVMKYIMNLPRRVIIKGNHELLFDEMCARGYPETHDVSNGTANTIAELGYLGAMDGDWSEACDRAYKRTRPFFKEMVNYFETENYIFVHSWIPTHPAENLGPWYLQKPFDSYNPNWREGNNVEWESAMWGNPFKKAAEGLNKTDKIIVFGHWHCSTGWAHSKTDEFGLNSRWDPYYGEGFIAIDRCTAATKQVNVLVLEDNFISSK